MTTKTQEKVRYFVDEQTHKFLVDTNKKLLKKYKKRLTKEIQK